MKQSFRGGGSLPLSVIHAKNTHHIVVTAGGTGGHFFPALSLTQGLQACGERVTVITDQRTQSFGEAEGSFEMKRLHLPPSRGGMSAIKLVLKMLKLIPLLWRWMRREKVSVIVGFGGYPSVPALVAAYLARVTIVLHEQNALLGRVNRLFAPVAKGIALSFQETQGVPPSVRHLCKWTGNPVRPAFEGATWTPPREDGPLSLAVLGGSQGAHIMCKVAPAIAALPAHIKDRLMVFHQARPEDLRGVEEIYNAAKVRAQVKPFFENIPQLMSQSSLVITRAGAATLSELMLVGCPALLIPYRYAMNNHQLLNAKALEECGAAVVFEEVSLCPKANQMLDPNRVLLETVLENMLQEKRMLLSMAAAMKSCGVPDAVQALVHEIQLLLRR